MKVPDIVILDLAQQKPIGLEMSVIELLDNSEPDFGWVVKTNIPLLIGRNDVVGYINHAYTFAPEGSCDRLGIKGTLYVKDSVITPFISLTQSVDKDKIIFTPVYGYDDSKTITAIAYIKMSLGD